MSYWNYRVVKKEDYFGIHEAYYEDGEEKPNFVSMEEMSPHGETLDELKKDLQMFAEALDKPILHYKDF